MSNSNTATEEICDQYDLVLVFPWSIDDSHKKKPKVIEAVRKINENKAFEYFQYLSVQNDELIILLRLTEKALRDFADEIDFDMKLDPVELKRVLQAGDPVAKIKPITINENSEYCSYSPYDFMYGRYEKNADPNIYQKGQNGTTFSKVNRMKLAYYLLQARHSIGGVHFLITRMMRQKILLAIFPMHDHEKRRQLKEKTWIPFGILPWEQPFDDIKDYFGEKIGMYFAFMGVYCWCLIFPAVLGTVFQIVVWATGNFSHPVLPFYCVFIGLWTIAMLEGWKRREKVLAMEWGTFDFEDNETDRPQFKGAIISSFIDGKEFKYFPPRTQMWYVSQSVTIISSLILLVLGVVSGIYILRYFLYKDIGENAQTVASILNSVQIVILNFVYGYLATELTNRENHRTDTEYEDSMIAKIFAFQFVNSYSSFYFIAFIAPYLDRPPGSDDEIVGECGYDDCMKALAMNLGVIYAVSLTVNNFIEIVLPIVQNTIAQRREGKGATEPPTLPEQEYTLLPYIVMTENMGNYAEVAIQFGYMTLFIVALPISSLVSLLNNIVEVKIDGWKLLTVYQRPIPRAAQDIGTWQSVFQLISVIAVITNAALICFTMSLIDGYELSFRFWVFIGFIAFLVTVQQIVSYVIPDEPHDVRIQIARHHFIESKVIDKVPDDDDEPEDDEDDSILMPGNNATSPLMPNAAPIRDTFEIQVAKYPRIQNPASSNLF